MYVSQLPCVVEGDYVYEMSIQKVPVRGMPRTRIRISFGRGLTTGSLSIFRVEGAILDGFVRTELKQCRGE